MPEPPTAEREELDRRFDEAMLPGRGLLPGTVAIDRRYQSATAADDAARRLTYLQAVLAFEARATERRHEGEHALSAMDADAVAALVERMREPVSRRVPAKTEGLVAAVANLETLCAEFARAHERLLDIPQLRERQREQVTAQAHCLRLLADGQWPQAYWGEDNLDGERRRLCAERSLG